MPASQIFRLALICGGPSQERGISLNSARSVIDHLKSESLEIIPIYVDGSKRFYQISSAQLYSNTPADFDFKLHRTATLLDSAALVQLLKSVHLVFPVIHGVFGEDGELQALLERHEIPFVGHSSACCQWMFPKHRAAETLRGYGFPTLPQLLLSQTQGDRQQQMIEHFFQYYSVQRAVVKPVIGGSSIGVYSVATPQEAYRCLQEIFSRGLDRQALLEPFCEGREFTVVVLENLQGEPVALIPTEVDLSYENHQIFDYRKKYLPTNQSTYHTPPRFSPTIVERLCMQAEQIFKIFGMRDFVRLDGWLTHDGTLYFTDINPLSGLEQNSFFFRQASVVGMSHRQALEYILKRSCQRYGLEFPIEQGEQSHSKIPVYVLFGNHNAERQVSLMTGTNVWLKLLQSHRHVPTPFLLDPQGYIWELPYSYTLNHTVEEIYANCLNAQQGMTIWRELLERVRLKLGIQGSFDQKPCQILLDQFLDRAQRHQAFVFIGLHGGEGENGTLQRHLESYQISFNGSSAEVSALCMDKYLTGQAIQQLADPEILSLPKKSVCLADIKDPRTFDFDPLWQAWCQELSSHRLVIKPRGDGCSAGIALLQSAEEMKRYCCLLHEGVGFIPAHTFAYQATPIEMPTSLKGDYLLEPYIETDRIYMQNYLLHHFPKGGWIELTVGVLECRGIYHALSPSITVTEGAILSVEEKFQGGTGINLTPPPEEIVSFSATQRIKRLVERVAQVLGIQNYARLDIFFNRLTEKIILIEVNTLPALTPSTVIYHQGLAEEPPLTPLALLDEMISSKYA